MDLPVDYTKLTWQERAAVRSQYIREQKGNCFYCNESKRRLRGVKC